jgi:UDP-3-O-[3-hydroxymyristoyl] glucosamine N-acyltransferase
LNHFNHSELLNQGVSESASVNESVDLGKEVNVGAFSVLSAGVSIGDGTRIYPQVYLGSNVKIGKNCRIYPGVRIYHDCVIGDDCLIHANTVIGSDGFGFTKSNSAYHKIPQIGNVVLENRVEVGANTVIDRATMGSTIIREGVKLDNLIQIAHNVDIGKHTVIAAQSGVAGSAKIGAGNLIGGQVGIAGHLKTAEGVQIQAKSGVSSSVNEPNMKIYGYPAIEYLKYLKSYAGFKQLPELIQRITHLESELKALRKHTSNESSGKESE